MRTILLFVTLAPLCCFSVSSRKLDGGSYKIPSCLVTYKTNDCTGAPLGAIQPDFAIPGRGLKENFAIKKAVGNNFRCRAGECCDTWIQSLNVDCQSWCQSIGHPGGKMQKGQAEECPQKKVSGYCKCEDTLASLVVDRLVVSSDPLEQDTEGCGLVSFELRNEASDPIPAPQNLKVWLGKKNKTGKFFTDALCLNPVPKGFVVIAQGMTSVSVSYQDTTVGEVEIRGSLDGFSPASIQAKISAVTPKRDN